MMQMPRFKHFSFLLANFQGVLLIHARDSEFKHFKRVYKRKAA
jgi:hypothetical protein